MNEWLAEDYLQLRCPLCNLTVMTKYKDRLDNYF